MRLTSSAPLISAVGSVLQTNDKGLVRVLHASIIDFFTSSNRCVDKHFFIDRSKYNRELAIRCLKTMYALKRDINDPTKDNWEVSGHNECLGEHLR